MTYAQFSEQINALARPVILVEGIRALPSAEQPRLMALGAQLARDFPRAIFRSGNAEGADEAFALGVLRVDPDRLELVVPNSRHGRRRMPGNFKPVAVSGLSLGAENHVAYVTQRASPVYVSLLDKRDRMPALKAKARYLLRDTVKVTGSAELGLAPANFGLFYVNVADPMQGGTGHTIRVCRDQGIPVVFQQNWMQWLTGE